MSVAGAMIIYDEYVKVCKAWCFAQNDDKAK